MKKTLKILVYICIIFLIVYNLVIFIKRIKNKNEIPSFLGYKNFIILSGSMEPTLNIGDVIFIKETEKIEENDIVSFNENGNVITHRVVEIIEQDELDIQNGKELYKTKGDANESEDQNLVAKEDIEGVYCFKIPKIGVIITFLQSKVGIVVFLGVLLILYICMSRANSKKDG